MNWTLTQLVVVALALTSCAKAPSQLRTTQVHGEAYSGFVFHCPETPREATAWPYAESCWNVTPEIVSRVEKALTEHLSPSNDLNESEMYVSPRLADYHRQYIGVVRDNQEVVLVFCEVAEHPDHVAFLRSQPLWGLATDGGPETFKCVYDVRRDQITYLVVHSWA